MTKTIFTASKTEDFSTRRGIISAKTAKTIRVATTTTTASTSRARMVENRRKTSPSVRAHSTPKKSKNYLVTTTITNFTFSTQEGSMIPTVTTSTQKALMK